MTGFLNGRTEARFPKPAPKKKTLDAASKLLLAVADSAVTWWVMKRPIQWSLEQHFANPAINCVGNERRLAEAVAEWCKIQGKG